MPLCQLIAVLRESEVKNLNGCVSNAKNGLGWIFVCCDFCVIVG